MRQVLQQKIADMYLHMLFITQIIITVFCDVFQQEYLQNGGACDHNPDSVHLIMGSPMSTNPSLQLYWTVLPTKQCPLSITLPFKGGKGEGQDMALHLGTCPDQTPSDPHSIVSGPTRAQPNGHKNEAWPRKLKENLNFFKFFSRNFSKPQKNMNMYYLLLRLKTRKCASRISRAVQRTGWQ